MQSNSYKANSIEITDAFNCSGAKMLVNELYFFVRVPDNYKDLKSMADVCKEVYKELGITKISDRPLSTDSLIKSEMEGTTADGIKVLALASLVRDSTGIKDRYITIDVTGDDNATVNAVSLRGKIEEIFSGHNLKANVNSCITGTYEGNLADSQLEGICKKILKDSNATKVNSSRDNNIISVSAFSPSIKDRLTIKGENVNLSLAIRYNKLENKTYIWVATPVVNTEY